MIRVGFCTAYMAAMKYHTGGVNFDTVCDSDRGSEWSGSGCGMYGSFRGTLNSRILIIRTPK